MQVILTQFIPVIFRDYGPSGTITINGNSTDTNIVFSTEPNWVSGDTFISWDSGPDGAGSQIAGAIIVAGYDGFTLEAALPGAPTHTSSNWAIFSPSVARFYESEERVDVSRFVSNVSFESDIEKGFSTCSIEMHGGISQYSKFYSRAYGYDVKIYSDVGTRVWSGIVAGSTLDGYGGTMECVGYGVTNDWFLTQGANYAYNDANVTLQRVIGENITYNPYIVEEYKGIDRRDPTVGGVTKGIISQDQVDLGFPLGPINFDESPGTLNEAFSSVTKYGAHGVGQTNAYYSEEDDVKLQFWHDRIATTQVVPREFGTLEANWIIDEKNFADNLAGFSIEASFEDIIAARRVAFTDILGLKSVSLSTFNYAMLAWFGHREEMASSGTFPYSEGQTIVRNRIRTPLIVSKPGGLTVTGMARPGYNQMRRHVSEIKAGDIVRVVPPSTLMYPYENSLTVGHQFIVGRARYNSSDETMTLTVYSHSNLIEKEIAILALGEK